jgi:hypothetical protein
MNAEEAMSQTRKGKSMRRVVTAVVCTSLVAPALWTQPVAAGEKGKFRGLAVLVSMQFQQVKGLEGHPGGAQMVGELDGVIFNDHQLPFLDKAHYQVVWKGDSAGGTCFKTFAMPDGKVFARCEGKPTPTGHQGTVELMGGTGRYAGIKGKGNFYLTNVSERTMWDVLEWEYEIP